MLQKQMAAKRRMIPKSGYNVVGVDTYELPGEELYIISEHTTEAEAQEALKVFQRNHPGEQAYVYGPDTK